MDTSNSATKKSSVGMVRACANFLRSPSAKLDSDALLFSAKSFAAAMLAYYISLRVGLPKPYWAIVTVYIVSQGSAGASLSRGVYRLAGTIAGAVATVAIVPHFVNNPIACSVVLSCWIGLCLYFSLMDRTPRAYGFVLAGYTTSLIGFPSVLDPGAVFDTASLRVQEISIGILCTVLMHRFVLPKLVTDQFIGKLSATLRDARRLAGDALNGTPGEKTRGDRSRLAVDLLALQGLAIHLPYDPAPVTPSHGKLQQLHDRLARLLPLAMEIEDRINALGTEHRDRSDELTTLLGDVESWIAAVDAAERPGAAIELINRTRSLQGHIGTNAVTAGDRLAVNLAGHLAEMIGLLHDCDRLGRHLTTADRSRDISSLHWPRRTEGYVYHRDPWMAGRAALGAVIGILTSCAFWIWSAWPDGGMAVSIFGVCCTLFGNVDAPAPNVVKNIVGSIYGVAISLAYGFVILPRVTDFSVLVAVLAPVFLFAGSLQARPQTTLMAFGITLTVPILAGLGPSYTGDFAQALNTVIALFAGVIFGVVSMTLFQTVPVDAAINRLLRLSRKDVMRRAHGHAPDEAHWTNLMVDRTALLFPRLQQSKKSYCGVLDDTLHHLRIGRAVGHLRQKMQHLDGEVGDEARDLLAAIAASVGARPGTEAAETVDLVRRIDALMALIADTALADRSSLLDLLIDLRFALGPIGSADAERDL
ncbi:FUSC family protein [Rhodopseudomonas palustris]|uniref:Fusaric acid resistance protein conserved region n=1 Tax=Rhodopseudomonas palustris (strain BisB18) TaxID=316056 RepID=Q216Y8_RHOPB